MKPLYKALSILLLFLYIVESSAQTISQQNPYTGYYQVKGIPNMMLRVYQTADQKLMVVIPGEPNYELVPFGNHQYGFKAETNPVGMKLKDYKIIFAVENSVATMLTIQRPRRDFTNHLMASRSTGLTDYAINTETPLTGQRETAGFVYYFNPKDSVVVNQMIQRSEQAYQGLLNDFQIKRMPKVAVRFYSDLNLYHNAVNTPLAPAWQQAMTWGATNAYQEIRAAVPSASDKSNELMMGSIVHEFVHLLTLQISPHHQPSPVWLWEGVAIYKGCCQWVKPDTLSYLKTGKYPSIMEIESRQDYEKSYELGYYIIEYAVEKWGWDRFDVPPEKRSNIK